MRTTSKIALLLICVSVMISSCKKKKDEEPEPAPAPAPTPGPPTFNGYARAYNSYQYLIGQSSDSYAYSYARIFFTTNSLTTVAAGTTFNYTYGGMVVVNGNLDTLQYLAGTYEKNLCAQQYTAPVSWKVDGTNPVPSYSTNCSISFPGFNGWTSFPATLSKNAGITYTITGFTNTDRIIVGLSDGGGSNYFQREATLNGGSATVNFPASETANFTNGNLGYIKVLLYHDEIQTVNSFAVKYSQVREEFVTGFNITN